MPISWAVVIERNGVEFYRYPYPARHPGGAASALAEAYAGFREQVSDDGVSDVEITIRLERRKLDT